MSLRFSSGLLLSLVFVALLGAGCGGDSLPEPGVTIGCVPGATTPETLAEVCADPAGHETSRFALAGDWQQGQYVCTGAMCSPGTCCNFCQSRYTLPCPDGVRSVALVADPDLDLPTTLGSGSSPITTQLGCVGPGGSDDTDCSAGWRCSPDVTTLCWATGNVMSFDDTRILVEVDAINLSVEP